MHLVVTYMCVLFHVCFVLFCRTSFQLQVVVVVVVVLVYVFDICSLISIIIYYTYNVILLILSVPSFLNSAICHAIVKRKLSTPTTIGNNNNNTKGNTPNQTTQTTQTFIHKNKIKQSA